MRIILVSLYLTIFGIFSIIALPLLWLIGKFNPILQHSLSQRIVKLAFGKVLFLSGIKKKVIGVERVPKDNPVLFIINHRGFFDVILAFYTVPVLSGFVSKKEIAKVPGLRLWMRLIRCVFLDRENPREGIKAILKGIEVFEDHLPWIKPAEMTIEYGEPIYIQELSKEARAELLEHCRERVLELYEKNL